MDIAQGKSELQIEFFPLHSQSNEFAVQNTYKAAELKVGFEKRHAHIIMVNENRNEISISTTKADFLRMIPKKLTSPKAMNLAEKRAKYFCDICDSKFSRENRLILHKVRNHQI